MDLEEKYITGSLDGIATQLRSQKRPKNQTFQVYFGSLTLLKDSAKAAYFE
jgi:hypothetical protein